ncbi:hypothetical protein [Achromobacter aloeverae]|uniref:Lipoprotein n=1 Tax=Achromobacter aloeverae TaxID=1750518 RepID=A0A4Q1HQZ0_9BURK|nr:hypothetical protein [Achromobacter aloeverae]RXN92836.1 hypothetical protein C7R54_03590 [Achromobacter aloeverae]
MKYHRYLIVAIAMLLGGCASDYYDAKDEYIAHVKNAEAYRAAGKEDLAKAEDAQARDSYQRMMSLLAYYQGQDAKLSAAVNAVTPSLTSGLSAYGASTGTVRSNNAGYSAGYQALAATSASSSRPAAACHRDTPDQAAKCCYQQNGSVMESTNGNGAQYVTCLAPSQGKWSCRYRGGSLDGTNACAVE